MEVMEAMCFMSPLCFSPSMQQQPELMIGQRVVDRTVFTAKDLLLKP